MAKEQVYNHSMNRRVGRNALANTKNMTVNSFRENKKGLKGLTFKNVLRNG